MSDERIYRATVSKKRRKQRVIKRIMMIFLVFIAFYIGFCLGMLYKISTDTAEIFTEESQKEIVQKTEFETNKLEKLSKEFIGIINTKYPSVEFSFAIKNLDTGATIIHNNKKMNSASLIKLFILETVYNKISESQYTLLEERQKELNLMITESNNEAANNFIDDFGGQNEKRKIEDTNEINKHIKKRGYIYTELNRKMHDKTPPEGPSGYQNYTCAEDVAVFLEGIYNQTLLEEPYNTYTLNLLKNQQRRGKIPAKITRKYPSIIVANKTGELSQVENDAALILSDKYNLVFVVLIDNIPFKSDGSTDYDLKEEIQETISDLALQLVDFYEIY